MAEEKKTPKEASNIFHSIMKASVKGNPKPKPKKKATSSKKKPKKTKADEGMSEVRKWKRSQGL
jgi:hypothetical protein